MMASVVLMCAAGAFMSAYAQEQPKPLQQTPPQALQQTPDRTPPQAGSGYEIGGLVQDAFGPVIGATVVEVGTANGTSTDIDGRFSLTVGGPDARVEVTCIGYAPQTFTASQLPATITLMEEVARQGTHTDASDT